MHTDTHMHTHARTHARAHAHNDNDDDNKKKKNNNNNSLHCFGSSVVLKPLARAPNHKQLFLLYKQTNLSAP